MKHSRRRFIKLGSLGTFVGLSGVGLAFSSCHSDDAVETNTTFNITGVSIPSSIDVSAGGNVTITGKGFKSGDKIELTSTSNAEKTFARNVTAVTDGTVTFTLPEEGFTTGKYSLRVIRGSESLMLGSLLVNLVTDQEVPDVAGMTVKGIVSHDGVGMPGVVVSDGFEVTSTNENGHYYLPSQKKTGFVFISIPGNYEVVNSGNAPQFFARLNSSASTVEQKDFSLIAADNENHVVIPMADWHLADRNNDKEQFTNKVLPDVNATINKYAGAGTKVYALTLGDLTWDIYWYSNNFGLNEYIPFMNKVNSPVFNLMGNHDNDPYYADDWEAENKYRDVLGPNYYSFNLGQIHYIVLDDTEYLNSGGAPGNVGERNYNGKVVSDQMEWLRKDLATITDKSTPIVLATHIPIHRYPTLDGSGNQVDQVGLSNGSELMNSLSDFSNVHVLTGHTHTNFSVEKPTLMEHNIGAICATWWWTGKNGYAGNHICKDGSPGGYGIWKMNGRTMEWLYKSVGHNEDYQFRAYDLNEVHITAAKFAPKSNDAALAPYASPYNQKSSANEVLINVWGYDPKWQVEVTENGQRLEVSRIRDKDPLHIISYDAFRLENGATPTSAFSAIKTSHMFKVTASAPDSALIIKVTDRFGHAYQETMERPKAFSLSMS